MEDGDIVADQQGRVYLTGLVGEDIPVKPDPLPGASDAYLLILSPDMKTRLFCTRPAGGKGSAHCVDARAVDGRTTAVYGSGTFTLQAVQKNAVGKDGFFVLVREQ